MTLNYCQIAKIVVANPSLLDRAARGGGGGTIKVHIDRTRDDGKWTASALVRLPEARPDRATMQDPDFDIDEWREDFGGSATVLKPLSDALFADVFEAMEAKDSLIDFINEARRRDCPIEHAIAAASEDLQEDYGKGRVGYRYNGRPIEPINDGPGVSIDEIIEQASKLS
jgi:hypothetical protein